MTPSDTIRLQKRLAQLGVASRRASEKYILEGRVTVNGTLATALGTKVQATDVIAVDGTDVEDGPAITLALFKPPGMICTAKDPQGRPTIYDLLGPELPFLAHVGRLDYNTEGLLLLTTDGDLARALLDPETAVPRVYEVKIRGRLSKDDRKKIEAGIRLDGRPTRPVQVEKLPSKSKHDWLQLTLFEGKNRHIHRILATVGTSVTRLKRVSFGPVTLASLRVGEYRQLSTREAQELRRHGR